MRIKVCDHVMVRIDHNAGPLHILLVEKEGTIWFKRICLKLYQFKKITWWCLYVLEYVMEFALQSIMLKRNHKNSWSPGICVEVGLTKIMGDHETLSIVCHVELHIDFSSMKSSLGL